MQLPSAGLEACQGRASAVESRGLVVRQDGEPMSFQPIERRKVYELIADQLLAEISERRLQPGDVIPPERELTRLYRAGRSSVREALRMLESRGVITPAGGGAFAVAGYANPLNSSLRLLPSLDHAPMHAIYELPRIL